MNSKFTESISVLDRSALKLIAAASMLIDHIGTVFFNAVWMRCVGRLAMPIFCFFVAEGFYYTSDRLKYLKRMGLFALISELPFDLAFYGEFPYWGHQNVMCTFFLAILAMYAFQELTVEFDGDKGKYIGIGAALLCSAAAIFLKTDYSSFGVALVFIFFVLKDRGLIVQNVAALICQLIVRGEGIHVWAMASAIPLMMYNGEKGRNLKWFFYCLYPGHLLILGMIKYAIR
ncbi:MAG: conjugal transfer protein TraX [Clostridia bacterium]|nr:conjugal transfer protein TraX [Clostridia bacterium]